MRLEDAKREVEFYEKYLAILAREFTYKNSANKIVTRCVRYNESLVCCWGYAYCEELVKNKIIELKKDTSSKYTFAILHPNTMKLINRFFDSIQGIRK